MLRVGGKSAIAIAALVVAAMFLSAFAAAAAESDDGRRIRAGGKLFRALLAADLDLEQKTGDDGRLLVIIIGSDPELTAQATGIITGNADGREAEVRGTPLRAEVRSELPPGVTSAAGIFVADPFPAGDIESLAAWGIEHGIITYSPFEGHVEAGILAGLAVEARVRPFINRAALAAAGIRLKPFFIKVAKMHE